ncbi:pseudaminic acid synthase [Mumia sp. zg.B21]|uniref:pseudaminic acid synthase n=1 Tax=Mumia sp. zg.B21 TaxID=2855447 RepID=UPI001C6E1B7E|nr:pseudaminic acid synthase [Mumia sp. zg.B21]MBW9209511.1 pseudaminic acid synthase [Mumia sp. zg.B21]
MSDLPTIMFGSRPVGPNHPPFVIAEMSGNHGGDLGRALDIVRAAADAGASALKIQTFTADTITIDVDSPRFRLSEDHPLWPGRRLYELYQEASTPWEWHEPIFSLARELGMVPFSAAFDPTAVDFLVGLGVPVLKSASSEITDLPLIRRIAETGLPMIISTGTATLGEIDAAVRAARETGNEQIVVLSCTVSYPAPPEASNLRGIPVLRDALNCQVGLSDHTLGLGASVAAIALGATVIEKHLTLGRDDGTVDSDFSLTPGEMRALVTETTVAWQALGEPTIGPRAIEAEGLRFRRSLFVVEDVNAGDPVTSQNVRSIRPADGLAPDEFSRIEDRTFRVDAKKGTPMSWELL